MHNLIKDLADCEKPYEKAIELGVECLSDAELLAIILRTGTRDTSVIDLVHKVLNVHPLHKGLSGLSHIIRSDLTRIHGIGDVKATQLLAVAELANRIKLASLRDAIVFRSPDTIAAYYQEKCRNYARERTFLLLLNNAYALITEIPLSEGTVNQALISPRDIFIEAIRYEAVHMILVHNHPSGCAEPSEADLYVTRRIKEAGMLLDIKLSDHIIVAGDQYISLLERGIL